MSTARVSEQGHSCRSCGAPLTVMMCDLGLSPVANDYVEPADYARGERFYPLEAWVCSTCWLVQTRDFLKADELFRADYAYFSSHSTSFLNHARTYVDMMVERFGAKPGARMVELASNDGYLLQFAQAKGLACLGVEPSESVALAAREKGIETRIEFFGVEAGRALAAEGWRADLMAANNVFAHVPDINDFVGGMAHVLAPEGVATIEVQHVLKLMQRHQFDTIYHEHFSYLSLLAAQRIFARAGLRVFDVEELETHGGSIRFFVCHDGASHRTTANPGRMLQLELEYGLGSEARYLSWAEEVKETKRSLLTLLIDLKRQGKTIAAYGAPAKGVTLLNYCGAGRDMVDFTVDKAPSKQGRLYPGLGMPILAPSALLEAKPDYVLLLVWNLAAEVMAEMAAVRDWGGKFIAPVPVARILD